VRIHQNDRIRDGYGLKPQLLAEYARNGYRLVITVDCGISDVDPVREASANGMEVIVTDHHLPGEAIPGALAVVNPRQLDCEFPEKELAGVGVVFLLLCALRKRLREAGAFNGRPEPAMRRYLDLVALGTVADMAPLRGGNRLMVREGLREIRKSPRAGVEALFAAAGVPHMLATEADLGFRVGPRLNAAGRIGEALRSSQILIAEKLEDAMRIARDLNEDNARRQREEERILAEVERRIEAEPDVPAAIVLSDAEWHPGILGIVASKILDRYGRPVVLLREERGVAAGSCRSAEGFPIVDVLSGLSHLLLRFGGHAQAAGLALVAEKLPAFRDALVATAAARAEIAPFVAVRRIDAEIRIGEITPGMLADLTLLRPFGVGNDEPLFLLRNARVTRTSRIGAGGKHLRFEVEEGGRRVGGVAFHRAEIPSNSAGRSDLVVAVQENVYRGTRSARLLLRDAVPPGEAVLCAAAPPR
jgi:single-stranded-DNA-specific exonuclease